jgi:molecular chaperone DnaK (HSP70)
VDPLQAQRYQFEVFEKAGMPCFGVEGGEGGGRRDVTPVEVGSLVLAVLKKSAERQLKLDKPLKMVVMSVPAGFGEQQRNATIEAARLAGLDVLRVISEPTAAAMAYGLHDVEKRAGGVWKGGTWVAEEKAEGEEEDVVDPHAIPASDYTPGFGLILVFDFGGGTLDVSLLGLDYGVFVTMVPAATPGSVCREPPHGGLGHHRVVPLPTEVCPCAQAIAGNSRLGGEDFTHAMAEAVAEEYASRHGAEAGAALRASPAAVQAIRLAAEQVKLQLSTESSVTLSVDLRGLGMAVPAFAME